MHAEGLCVQGCAEGLAWLFGGGPAVAKAHARPVRLPPLGLGQISSPGWPCLVPKASGPRAGWKKVHGDSLTIFPTMSASCQEKGQPPLHGLEGVHHYCKHQSAGQRPQSTQTVRTDPPPSKASAQNLHAPKDFCCQSLLLRTVQERKGVKAKQSSPSTWLSSVN